MSRVLIVDDEPSILESLSWVLKSQNYSVDTALDGFAALEAYRMNSYDLVLLDIKMPNMDGLEVLEKMKEIDKDPVVIMISGHGNIETAVDATKKGAYNFLQKPLPDLPELKITIKNAIDYKKSKDEIKNYRNELIESNRIVGSSRHINYVNELISKYADINSNVLITGESGTGKSLVAHQIHLQSKRTAKPFININCALLDEENIDEELFGLVENGILIKPGKIWEAQEGTVLFDEVCNLSAEVQPKILKVIEENKFSRKGISEEINIDVRFLFSTNKDLQSEIEEGRFREDLYHRMNVLLINIPPVRERQEDIEALSIYFSEKFSKAYNIKTKKFSDKAISFLKEMRLPGNARELKNLIERLIFTVDKDVIDAEDIEMPGTKHTKVLSDLFNKNMSLNDFQNESEKAFIIKMLNDYKYNVSQTAEALQIQRSHLYNLINKYGLPLPRKANK